MENVGPILPNTRVLAASRDDHGLGVVAQPRGYRFERGSSVVGSASRSRWTLVTKSSSSVEITSKLGLRASRGALPTRVRADDARHHRPLRGGDQTPTARTSRTIQIQLTQGSYSGMRRVAAASRAASTRRRASQPSRWSLTRPIACMNA